MSEANNSPGQDLIRDKYTNAYSIEAEQAILGSVLVDPGCLTKITADGLKPEYFYNRRNRAIYSAMQALDMTSSGSVDALVLLEHLRTDKEFEGDSEGAKNYLFKLADFVPSSSNVESYCKIVKDKYYLRTLINVSQDIIEAAENSGESADAVLDNAEQRIYEIRQGKTVTGPQQLKDVMGLVSTTLTRLNSDDPEDRALVHGLPTGFADFDKMTSGLSRSDLVIVGARPAMGKTSFCLNMAVNVAKKITNKKVLFFSLEMSNEQLASRVISTEARIPGQKMRNGDLLPREWEQLWGACSGLAGLPLWFDDTANITVPEMKARIRRLKDVGCVFVDYLQLMKSANRTESRVQEVSDITRNLKLMAKDLMIPVVVCAQLTRGTEERGKSHKPQLSDLRESGSIEQDADIVVMLYREDYYKSEKDDPEQIEVNTAELLLQKNRHGPTGSIKMAWNPKFTLYTGVETGISDENAPPAPPGA